MTFEKVWEKLKAEDTTGTFAKAEKLSLVSVKAIEYAFNSGYAEGLKAKRPQDDIRWTDKLSVKSNGDIIDFEGRVVGHINLEDMKGGAEWQKQ